MWMYVWICLDTNIFICIYVYKYLCMSCWIFILINLCIHVNVCMNNLHIQTSSYGYGAFFSRSRSCYMFRWLHLMIYEITIPKTDLLSLSLSLSGLVFQSCLYRFKAKGFVYMSFSTWDSFLLIFISLNIWNFSFTSYDI